MNFTSCRHLVVSLLMYCGVAVLVIVNGQSTIDDDIDKDEIARLVDMVEVLRAKQQKLRMELAKSADSGEVGVLTSELPELRAELVDRRDEQAESTSIITSLESQLAMSRD